MSRGFDEFYGFLGGDHSYFESTPTDKNPLYEGRTPVAASGYLTDVRPTAPWPSSGARGQAPSSSAQLFNLADDIGEQHDLAATHAAKVKELADDWLRWSKEMTKPLWAPKGGGRGRGGPGPRVR